MGLDPSIVLGVRPIADPLESAGRVMSLKALAGQQQMQDLQRQQAELGIAQDRALSDAYSANLNSDGSVNMPGVMSSLARAGAGRAIPGAMKAGLDQQVQQANLGKTLAETRGADAKTNRSTFDLRVDKANKAITNISGLQSPDEARASLLAYVQSGDIDQDRGFAIYRSIPQNPVQFQAWKQQMVLRIMDAKDQLQATLPKVQPISLGGTTQMVDTNTLSNPSAVGQALPHTITPDAQLSANVAMRGQNMVDARKRDELAGAEQQFTPEAIANAAARYNIDGTLPAMGMGKAGAMGRSAILNEAARQAQDSGLSGDEQRIAQLGNKANAAALSKLQQQQTMVGAFERNFVKNADIALELSAKVGRTGAPMVNQWLNAGKRAVAGDPDLAAFDQAIKSASNEYAKIISGSMGNTAVAEGEIKKMEQRLNAAQTPEQVSSVIALMKRETQNRMAGFDEEKAQLRSTMSTARKSPATASATAASAPGGPPVPIKTDADYAKLPSGTRFQAPDGSVRVKP